MNFSNNDKREAVSGIRRCVRIFLTICVFAVAGISGAAAQEAKTANPASDFDYDLTEDGKGVIIKKYKGSERRVSVPRVINGVPVVALGERAFVHMKVTFVSLPNSITEIGECCFDSCESLYGVSLPNNLKIIGSTAFNLCTALRRITLPDSIQYIKPGAFAETGLEFITIPDSVIAIGDEAFAECTHLKVVNIGKNVIFIGCGAFTGCTSLQSVNFGFTGKIPSGPNVTLFGEEVTKGYDDDVFENCPSLDSSERKKIRDTGYKGVF